MPRDTLVLNAGETGAAADPLSALPDWTRTEKRLAHMLPYVSLVTGNTIRTGAAIWRRATLC